MLLISIKSFSNFTSQKTSFNKIAHSLRLQYNLIQAYLTGQGTNDAWQT